MFTRHLRSAEPTRQTVERRMLRSDVADSHLRQRKVEQRCMFLMTVEPHDEDQERQNEDKSDDGQQRTLLSEELSEHPPYSVFQHARRVRPRTRIG